MSFWPFNNSSSSNNTLLKFLDSIHDLSSVSVDDIVKDQTLVQELLNELHTVKGNINKGGNFLFAQSNPDSTHALSDSASLNSQNNDNNNSGSNKESKGIKLIELLIQPHILSGLIEILENSVDFFYQQGLKEEENIKKALAEHTPATDLEEVDEIKEAKGEDKDEVFRRSVQATADILSFDISIISSRIIETPNLINKLWSILKLEHLEENYPSVSYLVHILDQLLEFNSIELLNFIRRQDDLVDTFLAKIEVPAIMDYFFRIIQTDKPDSPTGILDTIAQQDVILKLVDILKPQPVQFDNTPYIPDHQLYFRQSSATDFLKALITISSNAALAVVMETNIGPNQLTRQLVSPEVVNIIVHEIMLQKVQGKSGKTQTNKHGINNCVSIVIELIRKNNSDYDLNCGSYSSLLQNGDGGPGEINSYVMFQWLKDFEQNPPGPRDPIYLGDMLEIFSVNLHRFEELLETEPIPPNGVTSDILGFTRFKISELIAELLHCSNMTLLNSKKIRKIISIRDHIRLQQSKRLKKALDEKIAFVESPNIQDVTSGLDDVSLDDVQFADEDKHDYSNLIKNIESIEDSEDEEPSISPENPFVCEERNKAIRSDPCVGDLFKIKLIDSKVLLSIVSKFTKYEWNNFFHNVVFDLVQQIFNGKLNSYNSFLIVELFKKDQCDLTDLIVRSYENEVEPRPGYMGHLILIGEEIVKFTSLYKPDLISHTIVEAISSEKWNWFVNDILTKTREVYNVVLGADEGDTFDNTDDYVDPDEPKKIILGDTSNHEEFVHDGENEDEDEDMDGPKVADVEVGKMTPSGDITQHAVDEDEELGDPLENNDVDHLSGSSSDEDEEDDGNVLRRVPNHNE
ncbi:Sap155 protein [Candida orthopsilosis Co 90-125]|uniref:Sap155 protein n=1 Tax=Candida orthopsilosis (strain 90-125) TaxID=1136231 RepID=H8X597_CANO9|nr:Sap155 protein [Candida orthopsilosis Co 90-125]CCG23190.1 Sap155 protein [Candida orthopsilosis Co 90-125]